ncbi:MAG TPA: aspartate kinase [Candidatus Avidesulfovibrio excrementigallinarum]|nr:aspartate kinase [Candidatus Avidesulfovibrio excrementigallinarum]
MRILVQKFGGTSVADIDRLNMVREKVKAALDRGYKVVVVLSARAGKTNKLLAQAARWADDPDLAEVDSLLSTGEQASVTLFGMLLKGHGIKARSVLGWQIPIVTDDAFGAARIHSIDGDHLRKMLETYDVLVVAGFQGVTEDGRITTLGRGGSDTSAVALAAALGSCECEIYTDVDGVYTTDPNMCSTARKLDRICYDEMLEMASMGAKVLQIRSVEFAKKYNVPVHVRSTFNNNPGTMVVQEDPEMEAVLVSGIAYDKDQALISLTGVPDRPGISATLFTPLAKEGIVVDMIIQTASRNGRADMAFTVPRKSLEKTVKIMEGLHDIIDNQGIETSSKVSKVSVIGVGMRNHTGVASKAFDALSKENINILMISTSEIKISCLIDEKYTELAVSTLHDVFELGK